MKKQLSVVGLSFLMALQSPAQNPDSGPFKATGDPLATLVNINDISLWVRADGWSGRNPWTGEAGGTYPRGTAPVIFQDGLVWGGRVKDGREPVLRVGGQTYVSGMVPGRIISKGVAEESTAPDVRIWRIRKDWQTADLTRDAAEFFNTTVDSVTEEQIALVRAQYAKDWQDWPWQKGAPFYDDNKNGVMDSDEEPGLRNADQVVWFVANDLDPVQTDSLYGSPPIGLEMQVTLWAYKGRQYLEQTVVNSTIFRRTRIIYKGTATTPDTSHIDSLFLGQWVDPDIGSFRDDFAGCDTTLQLGFAYNSGAMDERFAQHDRVPPAVGYTLLQGPIIPSRNPQSTATFNFEQRPGFENLPIAFLWHKGSGTSYSDPGPFGSYRATIEMYLVLQGYLPQSDPQDPEPFPDREGNPTEFMVCGDPVTGTGWIDGQLLPPGDRRFLMSSGPFTMALGDTQEVIIALVGGLGADNLFSVRVMKYHAKLAQSIAKGTFQIPAIEISPEDPPLPNHFRLSQNFPNPFNPSTEIRFELPVEQHITLTVYNTLGQKVKTQVDEIREAGSHTVTWDGTDEHGQPVPSGLYFYRFDAGAVSSTKKMILLR